MLTSAKSKWGEITFDYKEDTESSRSVNPGWVVDKIFAKLDGKEIGFLKISYIPKKNMIKFYPDVLHYLNLRGYSGIKDALEKGDKKEIARILSGYLTGQKVRNAEYLGKDESGNPLTDEWWEKQYQEHVEIAKKDFKREYQTFVEHWMDKPMVDYIDVEKEYHGGGVGYSLYVAGAKWMSEKGWVLYASALQSPEASKSWYRMKKLGLPVKEYTPKFNDRTKKRIYLDYR